MVALSEFDSPDTRLAQIISAAQSADEIADAFAAKEGLPGLAYGVISGGKLVHARATGLADIVAGIPATAHTRFRIASMTKSFAAAAILYLRDAGRLRLDDPAVDFVPELASLVYPTSDSPQLTLRHLLTMSPGWPEDNPWGDRQLALEDAAFSRLLADGVTFASAPEVQYEYSNLGYMILGRVVAHVSGMSLQEFVTRHILQPLGMTATCWNVDDAAAESFARGYRKDSGEPVEDRLAWMPSAGDAAAFGGLYTTVEDLARWVALLLSAWPPRDGEENPVLRRSSLREMQRCATLSPPAPANRPVTAPVTCDAGGYAFGLFSSYTGDLGRIVGHAGGLPGFGSHMVWLPEYDLGVVALANCTYAPAVPIALQLLRGIVANANLAPRRVRPSRALLDAQARVSDLLYQWDDDLADSLFAANFFLDHPRAYWQARIDALQALHGARSIEGDIILTNPLRGAWTLRGEVGWCRVAITLTPTAPPRIQYLEVTSVFPPGEQMQALLDALMAAAAAPSMRAVNRLFVPSAGRRAMLDQLRTVNLLFGACTVEAITGGDGTTHTIVRLRAEKGVLELELRLDRARGKLTFAEFRRSR